MTITHKEPASLPNERPPVIASRPGESQRVHFRTILTLFLALGVQIGVWAVLLADVSNALQLTTGRLGVAITLSALSGIVVLPLIGRIADRIGRRPVLIFGTASSGLAYLGLAQAGSYPLLLVAMIFSGISASGFDLGVNSVGSDYERLHRTRAMTLFHAGASGGAAAGALGAGLALQLGVDYRWIYSAVGLASLMLALNLFVQSIPSHEQEIVTATGRSSMRSILLIPGLVLVVGIIGLSFLTDGALESYTSIYLRYEIESGALLGAASLAAYYLAAVIGRLASTFMLRRVSEQRVLLAAGTGGAAGLLLTLATTTPGIAAIGLLIVGVSMSPVAPLAFSLAGRLAPGRTSQAISLATIAGYLAFVIGPVLVGTLADLLSLRVALLLFAGTTFSIAALSFRLPGVLATNAAEQERARSLEPVDERNTA